MGPSLPPSTPSIRYAYTRGRHCKQSETTNLGRLTFCSRSLSLFLCRRISFFNVVLKYQCFLLSACTAFVLSKLGCPPPPRPLPRRHRSSCYTPTVGRTRPLDSASAHDESLRVSPHAQPSAGTYIRLSPIAAAVAARSGDSWFATSPKVGDNASRRKHGTGSAAFLWECHGYSRFAVVGNSTSSTM